MLITKNTLFELVDQLKLIGHTKLDEGLSSIDVQYFSDAEKLSLTTPVFEGGNYIPPSVKSSLKEGPALPRTSIKTYVSVEEETFSIQLHYLGLIDSVEPRPVLELLEEFAHIAEEWRDYLNEQGEKDLMHVRK